MSDREEATATDHLKTDLLRKLENPLAFIGESRLSHICFDEHWTPVDRVFEMARRSSRSKDRVVSLLRERLEEIRSRLRSDGISRDEARTLFEEGIAVKHAIYVIGNNVIEDEDPHEDIKRWIRFGRSMG
jgi:hypothetical protein